MLCITIANQDKWVNVVNGKAISSSKHIDYALFHFKAADVKLLKQPFTKFVFVDAEGKVSEVILAAQLRDRGVNYKTAKREPIELSDVEQEEVTTAIELAREYVKAAATPRPTPATSDAKPGTDLAMVFLTPEAVERGLKEIQLANASEAATPPSADADQPSDDAVRDVPAETGDADAGPKILKRKRRN